MPGWRDEYLAGIWDAEKNNPVNDELVQACSQLADRVASLEAEKAALSQAVPNQTPNPSSRPSSALSRSASKAPSKKDPTNTSTETSDSADSSTISRLRLELAEALRSKGQFQTRLQKADDELSRLRDKSTSDYKQIRDLTAHQRSLTVKLRDREEELRIKNKLVADVQDELAVLEMQLNMAEKRRAEKEAENKQLVERFMRRVGQEAEAMNLANEPYFNAKRKP
ncbi:autophagy protein 16 [Diplogelasinospora grovesii]|uniref:Autophagy protein 16 n=1 Tax=Diplogelasinospora grovesii TaxID=303347 RepID=A0AAN6S065_9PEZI|nr:autophagy protein 16 [Diplogelasinospora grovesii]